MKFKDNILQLKKYWQIIYAVFLIVLIPAAIIANTVWVTANFRSNINVQLQRQALGLAEVFNATMQDSLGDEEALQNALTQIAEMNGDIRLADILVPEGEYFKVVAKIGRAHV